MGAGRKTRTLPLKERSEVSWTVNSSISARNLTKNELGAVIFGCKNHTINECLNEKMFGLPAGHYSYVKNITPGLPLFLFNYSDRKLHGIFEATSTGQMNISPHAWTANEDADHTRYAAQVRVDVRRHCWPLLEEQFKPIIAKNYYKKNLFRFELDKKQSAKLINLFSSSPVPENMLPRPPNAARWNNSVDFQSGSNVDAAEMSLTENKHSYATIVSNRDASAPEKKWTEMFETSSSSSGVKNIVEPDKEILNSSLTVTDGFDMDWKLASSSQETSELLPARCPDSVVECWEEQSFESSVAEESVQASVDTEKEVRSGNSMTDRPYLENSSSPPREVLTDLRSSDFESVIVELIRQIEGLKEQMLKFYSLERELVESKLEIAQLKSRCHKLESASSK